MAIYQDIQNGLTAFVRETLSSITVVGENERYKPVLDTPYAQLTHLPATTSRQTLGETGQFRYIGLMQVSIFVPTQTGAAGNDLIDLLVEAVHAQPIIDIGTTGLHLRQVTRLVATPEADWYHLPCRIEYWAFA